MTQNANHPDYWQMLKAAHRDIGDFLITELYARSAHRSYKKYGRFDCTDLKALEWHEEMLAKAEANPLLARLRASIPKGQEYLWM
jgi:hypothetical protein